ncbi:MAG: 3-dehydroquinate synthase [Longimicrobiales bacterium]
MTENAREVITLEPAPPRPHTEIVVERGLMDGLPALLAEHAPAPTYAIVADETVAELYARRVRDRLVETGHRAELFTFPEGEFSKTPDRWAELVEDFGEMGLGRDGCVLGIGGGVTTDLAGFAAATYARGIAYIPVPTSLLGMIDAALGGKTGVDLRAGKNLAGAFHHPVLVVMDPGVLDTLPDDEYRTGLAEAVKHGAIADAGYFDFIADSVQAILARSPAAVDRVIGDSIRIKAGVVARDAAEAGERAVLNFGHTIAHGVERATAYSVHHGQAVAIGMVAEARLGERIGVTDPGTSERIRTLLTDLGLPTSIPTHVDPAAVLESARSDKKAREGQVRYALITRIGEPARTDGGWTRPVPDTEVAEVLGPGHAGPHAV